MIKVKSNSLGYNGNCENCGKSHNTKQSNPKKDIVIIYIKEEGKRGRNIIVCNCEKCINEMKEKINGGNK